MIFCKMLYTITKDCFKESGPFVLKELSLNQKLKSNIRAELA